MCALTCTAGSVGVAISYESIFTLAPITWHFWHKYQIRRLIPRACIMGAFHDLCLIQISFRWEGPYDLDLKHPIVYICGTGMVKGRIILGAHALRICSVDSK